MILNRFKKRVRKLVVVTGLLLLAGAVKTPSTAANTFAPMTAYAAEQQQTLNQSPRWEQQANGEWKVRTEDGKGHLKNTWFQDLDGSWYMIGADGYMLSGLITDQSTGKTYYLETLHNGYYGRMIEQDGTYNINGKQVYLTTSKEHDGNYGHITSGLSSVRNTGVTEKSLTAIPVDSAAAQSQTQTSAQLNTGSNTASQSQKPKQNFTGKDGFGREYTLTPDEVVYYHDLYEQFRAGKISFDSLSQETRSKMQVAADACSKGDFKVIRDTYYDPSLSVPDLFNN